MIKKGYLLNKMTFQTFQMMQQLSDYTILSFWKYPDLIWNIKWISKTFGNPKMILKILVIPIKLQNRFQTIELQVTNHIIRSLLHHLMTCTSIVWNQFWNWIGITKIFKIIFGLRQLFEINFIFQMRSWNFQNGWII